MSLAIHLGAWRTSELSNRQVQIPLCDVNDDSILGELTDDLAKVTCENCKADHFGARRPTCYGYEKCNHNGYCDDPCHYDVDRIVSELRTALGEACDYLAQKDDGGMRSTPDSEIERLRKLTTSPSNDAHLGRAGL